MDVGTDDTLCSNLAIHHEKQYKSATNRVKGQKSSHPEKIRYSSSDIKICKSGGKRTASAMCSFQRKAQKEKSKLEIKHRSVSECIEEVEQKSMDLKIKNDPSSSGSSNLTNSDVVNDVPQEKMDDTMSTVSDVSDLSVMSLTYSPALGGLFRQKKPLAKSNYSQSNGSRLSVQNHFSLEAICKSREQG